MNARVFNISIGASVALIGAGVGMQLGVAAALFVVGCLVLVLTILVARFARGG